MKIVKGIDKNDVINYLMDEVDVYSIEANTDRVLNLTYETVATLLKVIDNDKEAVFIVVDEEDVKGGVE